MEAAVFYFLMLQKYINPKQKTLKEKKIPCVQEIFQAIFQPIIWEKTGLNGCVCNFSVYYRAFDTSNIIEIHKYFMKKHDIK